MVATGYLREEDSAYVIGPAVGALLIAAPPTLDLTARPEMEKLHRQFDETVMLASQVGDSVVYTDAIESTRVIRYSAPLHTRRPLYPTSAGKCILAFAPARMRENYLATHISEPEQRDLVRPRTHRDRDRRRGGQPGRNGARRLRRRAAHSDR